MSTTNKATFSRFHDAVNSGDLDVIATTIDEVIAPDAVFHAPMPPGTTAAQAQKLIWATLLRAFPDIHVEVEDVIAEGDKLVIRDTVTGTHQGEYLGVPPTGKSVRYNEIFVLRFTADGRIAEVWGVVDALTQHKQLGLIPAH